MLRRRKSDPPFLRENLATALQDGVACEVDLAFTADGHALCVHDSTLDRETTGHGPVAEVTRAQVERLVQRGSDGKGLGSAPLFLDEIVATVRESGVRAPALVQLDVKAPAGALTRTASRASPACWGKAPRPSSPAAMTGRLCGASRRPRRDCTPASIRSTSIRAPAPSMPPRSARWRRARSRPRPAPRSTTSKPGSSWPRSIGASTSSRR
ncbi:MAG: hypothetical protein IPI73_12670 [Betaproteobacteria bacterium]|nr:hypothetical protein [Betaproteobacteria bacterium]